LKGIALKPGRNEMCPCGSGKKFKKCCIDKKDRQYNLHYEFDGPISIIALLIANKNDIEKCLMGLSLPMVNMSVFRSLLLQGKNLLPSLKRSILLPACS
jgi:hypothetical protein